MSNSHYNIVYHKDKLGGFYGIHEVYVLGNKTIVQDNPILVGNTKEEILENLSMIINDATNHEVIVKEDDIKETEHLIEFLKCRVENINKLS